MVRSLVAARLETKRYSGGEHAGVFARTIIVDRLRPAPRTHQHTRHFLADWPMRPAGEIALVEPCLREQAPHCLKMNLVTAVRRASDGKLIICKIESVGCTALDEWNGLHRLDCRARVDEAFDVAKRD